MMRPLTVVFAMAVAAAPMAARAQTHAVEKPDTVVRAVAVYEWTGDEAKPTGSRLVPVSVFINKQLEDAGIYLARPVPFALDTGTVFEVQHSGLPEGVLQLVYERHLEGRGDTPFDDGWLGYGAFKPAATQAEVMAAKQSGPLPQVVASGGKGPHFGGQPAATETAAADDSSRPSMKRRTDSGSGDATASSGADSTAGKTPASSGSTSTSTTTASADPDRPVLQRRSDSGGDASSTDSTAPGTASTTPTAGSTGSDTSGSRDDSNKPTMRRRTPDATDSNTTDTTDDADRPTLKKRTPVTQGKNQKRPQDQASVVGVGSLNDDADRPTLHRGSGAATPDIPALLGLPKDMRQKVAVSDAKDRPEHDFSRTWDSDVERADVLAKMEAIARARLAKYDVAPPVAAAPPTLVAPPAPAKAPAKSTAKTVKPVAAPPPPPAAPVALGDEQLRGYTLSYGGAATYVYSASSPGVGGATRYVSVVAQREPLGELKVALSSVTDSNHLDRTPWMRLVDVVDAEASNRASLLFELRAHSSRQFALYRVIGAAAEQIFQTGTTE
jgi:hypothetical protein